MNCDYDSFSLLFWLDYVLLGMIKSSRLLALLLMIALASILHAEEGDAFSVERPKVVLTNVAFSLQLTPEIAFNNARLGETVSFQVVDLRNDNVLASGAHHFDSTNHNVIKIASLKIPRSGRTDLKLILGEESQQISLRAIPAFLSIVPPLLAILLALITRQVIVALFVGIWTGVIFVYDFQVGFGFLKTVDTYIIQAINSADHISIIVFSMVLGGMVGVITRSGGTQGIVDMLSRYARDSRRGQLATWAMGIFIFFDDYANTLIVGNTMRPLTDKLRISREKLSYLVDSTAAPVANIAIISTWIGYELGLISQSFEALNVDLNPYLIFIQTIPYNFYPLYALIFVFLIALLLRDFGPMRRAEIRVNTTGEVLSPTATPLSDINASEIEADPDKPRRWYNALIPVLTVIFVVCAGLIYTGWLSLEEQQIELSGEPLIRQLSLLVGNSDSFAVLAWAAFIGSITAILLAVSQRLLRLGEAIDAWVQGIRSMVMAVLILVSAWAIGSVCHDLFTADYVINLTQKFLSPHWLPVLTFLAAAVIAFSTGTSWGTMAILMPVAIPLAYKFPQMDLSIDAPHAMALLLSSTASVLAGATFGDHCSPISDTTIMSSMASGADHIDHVRTQLPYALSAGFIACAFGYIPVGFGLSTWLALPLGVVAIFLIVRFIGKPIIGNKGGNRVLRIGNKA